MHMKIFAHLLLATLLLACKPAAQATTQPASAAESAPSEATELGTETSEDNRLEEIRKRAPDGITHEYLDCMDQALGTIERGECVSGEERRQDVRLNESYKKLLALLDQVQKERLIEAQREWLVLRNKDSSFEASLFENTQPENIAGAEREVFYIAERADKIQEWLEMANAD
jgi:uncharacterized protein YecT (DUF1311 family)